MAWTDILSGIIGEDTNWGDVASVGLGLLDSNNQSSAGRDYVDLLRQQEQNAWEQGLAEYNHYNNWLANKPAADTSGSRKTDAARRAALMNAQKQLNKALKKSRKALKPYAQAGKSVLPQHVALYNQGASGLGALGAMLMSPENMAKYNQPTTFTGQGAGIASFLPKRMVK